MPVTRATRKSPITKRTTAVATRAAVAAIVAAVVEAPEEEAPEEEPSEEEPSKEEMSEGELFPDDSDDSERLVLPSSIVAPDGACTAATDAALDMPADTPAKEQQQQAPAITKLPKHIDPLSLTMVNAFDLSAEDELLAKQQLAAAFLREHAFHDKMCNRIEQQSANEPFRHFGFYTHGSDRDRVLSGLSINDGKHVLFDDGLYSGKHFCSLRREDNNPNAVTFVRYHESLGDDSHPVKGVTKPWGPPVEVLNKEAEEPAGEERMVKVTAKTGKGGSMATWIPAKEALACGLEVVG